MSLLTPQPWDSQARASPLDQSGERHSTKGGEKAFFTQAQISATILACDNSQQGCAALATCGKFTLARSSQSPVTAQPLSWARKDLHPPVWCMGQI